MNTLCIKKIQAVADISASQVPALLDKAQAEWHRIDTVNWDAYPYKPEVSFRIVHTGDKLLVHYRVTEESVRAVAAHDDGRVWEDSCCEFFVSPDGNDVYYNLECNCGGTLLLHGGQKGGDRPSAPVSVLESIDRWASLGRTPFEEQVGERTWELALVVPASAFFLHAITDFSGLVMRANFYKCGDLLRTPHFLSWSPIDLPRPQFHCPQYFGEIRFAED